MFNLTESSHPELVDLLGYYVRTTHRSSSSNEFNRTVLNNSISLLNRDFAYVNIDNLNGQLCDSYPEVIPFLLSESIEIDSNKLSDLLGKCKRARCRNRFVVPVIKLGDHLLCRSATLSASVEMLYRNGWDYLFGSKTAFTTPASSSQVVPDRESFDNIRGADIQLLKFLGVSHIVDLMLENNKYKYGLKLTSSEKVDKENRYSGFNLVCLPFPGVEHFSDWVENGYVESGLRFNWSQQFITAEMKIPDELMQRVDISSGDIESRLSNWSNVYQNWDTVKLTQSYLKLILKLFLEESNGVLVHCISGWDRTPLFVSLVRISLWADGAIHKSLNAAEMLYFTIAYDWFLFSHDLADRAKNRQEIFRYCFSLLRYIEADEFSVEGLLSQESHVYFSSDNDRSKRSSDSIAGLVEVDASMPARCSRLRTIRAIFENAYAMSCPSSIRNPEIVETYQQNQNNFQHAAFGQQLPNSLSSLSRWLGNLSTGNNN